MRARAKGAAARNRKRGERVRAYVERRARDVERDFGVPKHKIRTLEDLDAVLRTKLSGAGEG